MKWFRFYHEALDDPKVQMLPPELFKTWVNLLCIASRETLRGTLPETSVLAFQLRISNAEVTEAVSELVERGLLDEHEEGFLAPHNWSERQPESDDVAQRVAAHRAKQQAKPEKRTRNVTSNVTVTPPEERRGDTDTEEKREIAPDKPTRKRDLLFEQICSECYGKSHADLTDSERDRANKAAKELRKIDAGPNDVAVRAERYRARSPDYPLMPQTLTKLWSDLEHERKPAKNGYRNNKPTTADHNAVIDDFGIDLNNINHEGRGR